MTTKQLILEYSNKGINWEMVRYSRRKGYLVAYMDHDGKWSYNKDDIESWISLYIRAKDGKRGRWQGVKNDENE